MKDLQAVAKAIHLLEEYLETENESLLELAGDMLTNTGYTWHGNMKGTDPSIQIYLENDMTLTCKLNGKLHPLSEFHRQVKNDRKRLLKQAFIPEIEYRMWLPDYPSDGKQYWKAYSIFKSVNAELCYKRIQNGVPCLLLYDTLKHDTDLKELLSLHTPAITHSELLRGSMDAIIVADVICSTIKLL